MGHGVGRGVASAPWAVGAGLWAVGGMWVVHAGGLGLWAIGWATAPWAMGRGPRAVGHRPQAVGGPWVVGHGAPWAVGRGPWGGPPRCGSWAVGHGPWPWDGWATGHGLGGLRPWVVAVVLVVVVGTSCRPGL